MTDATAAGVHPERLRRSDLAAPFHGLRVPADADLDLWRRCFAYQVLRPDSFVSHLTAARIRGLPVPYDPDAPLDMAVFVPARAPRGATIRGHRLSATRTQAREFRGLMVATPRSIWCQIAQRLTVDDLIVLGDALVRRSTPPTTLEDLAAATRGHQGQPGYRKLLETMQSVRPGTDSPRETRLRLTLIAAGLPEPEVNAEIIDHDGRFLARGDLVYREQRVIVEYDGDHHRTSRRQYERDIDRRNDLAEAGWIVITINRSHRHIRLETIIDQVRRTLLSRGWRPGAPTVLPRSVA
ncbi:MAG TPA: DUF559 domain-containing protein [Candidatus Ruania gallistercoris]|uniref:DUF559 domain-containing protein n=1 Tax=Candidatus Ruania gallistercoris TaxID=2838746 RepID=A0A9D2EDB8_9MICO|nr:DUF559 domain-containing protein [Candidatus Ruania gallistercoris]